MDVRTRAPLTGPAGRWVILFLSLLLVVQLASAQVTVSLIVRNPMPSQLSTWQNDPTLVQLIIMNPVGTFEYRNVRASFVVEDMNTGVVVMQSKDNDPSMPRFNILPGATLTRFGPDIVNGNNVSVNSSYQKTARTSNAIPEGQYQFCVTLIDPGNTPIGGPGKVCMPFVVYIPDPPTLTTPTDQSTVSALVPTVFSWTPVMLGSSQANYKLTIAPVFQNQTRLNAIQSNPPLLQKTLSINSYVYTQADPPFSFYPTATGFVWQVQALDQQNLSVAKNEGKSEIFGFTLQGSKSSSSPLVTLEQYYPFDNDTIPWIPPHLIVRSNPYSDSIKKMDYTLNVSGSDNSSYTANRTFMWQFGPRKSQGWPSLADTDRARYIITDLLFTGNNNSGVAVPQWAYGLKRGVKYTWSVNATFTIGGNPVTANTGSRSFYLGATSPVLTSPADQAVIDSAGQPVTLTWQNSRPDSLNPKYIVGMGSNLQKSGFKGAASEHWRVEMSHDSTFAIVDTSATLGVPQPSDSTGGDAPGLYGSRSFTLKTLNRGKYFWRTSWLDNGTPYLVSETRAFRIPTDTSQQKKQAPPDSGKCGGNYYASTPADQLPTNAAFSIGQKIKIGLFTMSLTKVTSASGTNLTGEGTIAVPYLHAPIMVEFTGLKVNKESEVIDGMATGKMDPGSPIGSTLADKLGDLGLKNSDISSIMNVASQPAKLVSALVANTPIGLPIGLDNVVQGFPMTVGIIGLTFTDTVALLNAVASFPLPDLGPNIGLGVGARGIPLQPGGLGVNEGTLYLAEDIGVDQNGSFGFRFKAPSKSDSGTYATWDCKGFKELHLRADVLFPRDWLTPLPDTGGRAAAKLSAVIRKPGDWLAAATMDSCEITGSSGMVLSVKDMTYDHSDVQNPVGIIFPPNYPKGKPGVNWHGFYIRSAVVKLPRDLQTFKGSAPVISVNNMIIDGAGFTASILASNVIQYPEGNFGEWGASIDTIGANFVCSSLTDGRMAGRVQIPIADSALVYSATLSTLQNGKLKFLFNIHPTSEVKASVWCATLGLDPSTNIVVADSAGKFWMTATLNGNFSVNGKVGDLPKIDLQLLQFQNLILTTNAPHIQTGTWKFGSPQHSMSGFPITISDVGIATGNRKNGYGVGLKFSITANLADVISGSTSLSIWGVLNLNSGTAQKFAFDGVDVDTIKVKADLGAVLVDGSIIMYHDDVTFGNGFRGELSATFVKTVEVTAVAQFGAVNGYRYWYVDASAVFNAGVTFGPVAMYGLGGGAWYHMKPGALPSSINGSPPPASKVGSSLSGLTFTPDQSSDLGFLANADIGISGRPQVFLCAITLGVNFVNGGIGSIFLNGDGYILASESAVADILSKKDATVLAKASISYDFVNSVFEGDFQFQTSGPIKSVFAASGEMNIHFDPKNWHVLIGIPNNRIKLTLASLATVDAYVMAGTDIPSPDLNNFPHKSDIEQAIGRSLPTVSRPLTGGPASGFALGASLSYTGDFTFLVFYAHMGFGMGFDIAVVDASTWTCSNSNGPPGVNGWFGYGQLFAYANFKMGIRVDMSFVKGDFPILDMGAGALCQFQAPNPIWIQGIVGGHFSILGGLVEGHAAFTFEIGEKCLVAAESPLKIDLFTGASPDYGTADVDVFATPSATIRFPIDEEVDLQTPDENGQPSTKSYRIVFQSFSLTSASNNSLIAGHWEKSQDGYTGFYVSDQPLPEHTQMQMLVKAKGFELNKQGHWMETKDSHGNAIIQDTSVYFTTGKRPDSLQARNVAWSIPLDRQRYFLYGEHSQGAIHLNEDMQYLFDVSGTYLVRFMPVGGGPSQDVSLTYDGGSRTILFPLTSLQPSTEYALQIIRQTKPQMMALSKKMSSIQNLSQGGKSTLAAKSGIMAKDYSGGTGGIDSVNVASPKFVPAGLRVRANEKLLYVLYFQTSKHATLAEKINQLKFSKTDHTQYWDIYEDLVASFASDEWWDDYDMHGFVKKGRNSNEDEQGDPLILVDAVHTNPPWFTGFARPSIYDHIINFAVRGLWSTSVHIADGRFYGQPSWTHPDPQAAYASSALGLISVPYVSTSPAPHSLAQAAHFSSPSLGLSLGASSAIYTLKVKYLHGTNIPTDFTNLYFTAMRVLSEFNTGGADDDGCEIYGKGDWIQNNLGWIQGLGSRSVFNFAALYTSMYEDTYTLDFAYSPKFDWNADGPWISKNFTYGHPSVIQVAPPVKAPVSSTGSKRIIRH